MLSNRLRAGSKCVVRLLTPLLSKEGLGEVASRSKNPPRSPLGKGGGKSRSALGKGGGESRSALGKRGGKTTKLIKSGAGIAFAASVVLLSVTASARAERLGGVVSGLSAFGVDFQGRHNIASGGVDLLVRRSFLGNPIDFGPADLTVQGPVSFDVSTGGRLIRGFDVTFSTALDGNSTPVPINYVFNADAGPQLASVSGTLLVDAGLSVNQFGFYKANLTYSSRQEVTRTGRFADDDTTNDFDLGPINLSGNLYADALALVTQPLFSVTNTVNVFAAFSGQGSLSDMLLSSTDAALLQLADGADGSTTTSRIRVLEDRFDDATAGRSAIGAESPTGGVVPEPTVLVLLLAGLPAVMRRVQ